MGCEFEFVGYFGLKQQRLVCLQRDLAFGFGFEFDFGFDFGFEFDFDAIGGRQLSKSLLLLCRKLFVVGVAFEVVVVVGL